MKQRFSELLGTSGAAIVELALVTPVFFPLILGTADFGSLLYTTQSVAAATRAGAQYARNSATCQQNNANGIQMLPVPQIGATCNTNIQTAMQKSGNFNPALTFPNGNQLICRCDGDNNWCQDAAHPMPANYSCTTNGRGLNQVFISVNASQAVPAPLFPWPGFPATVTGVTELRLQ